MSRMNRKLLLIGLLAVTALVVSTSEANAFWGWRGCGYSCYTPSYTSCYTPCYTSCNSSCNSSCDSSCNSCCTLGMRSGLARRWAFSPYRRYRNYNCCSTGYQSNNGCNTCSYTTSGSSCCQPAADSNDDTSYPSEPTMAAPQPGEQDDNNLTMPVTVYPTHENSAILTVWAPAKAKITINGYETKSDGSRRRYVSTGLQSGLTYKYDIVAQLPRNGKMAEETQTVYLTAGSREGVAFGFNKQPVSALAAAQ